MELQVYRRFLGEDYTIGTLFVDGVRFCDTLEDKVRDLNKDGDLNDVGEGKVYAQTAIPYGKYRVIMNYSPAFKRRLPLLLNVPHFEGIRIHRGNLPSHSSGCILLGENTLKGQVLNSTPYEIELVDLLEKAILEGEDVWIEIV